VLVASGGVAQYCINGFCRAVMQAGVRLKDLDEFRGLVKFSACQRTNFYRYKFAERIVDADGACSKGFASEALCAVVVLMLFCDFVLVPAGMLPQHVECLVLLGSVLDALSAEPCDCDLLEKLAQRFYASFCRLFPDCVKPKTHYLLHLPKQIKTFGNISCFAPERQHRFGKTVGSFSFRNTVSTLTDRAVSKYMRLATERTGFCKLHLVELKRLRGTQREHAHILRTQLPACQVAVQVSTHLCRIRIGDVVGWRRGAGELAVGTFLMAGMLGSDSRALFSLWHAQPPRAHRQCSACYAPAAPSQHVVPPLANIVHVFQCIEAEGAMHLRVPITL